MGLSFADQTGRRGSALRACIVAAGLGLALAALVAVAKTTRESLRQGERFALRFTEIDCQPLPPLPRDELLAEVQYLSGLPDRLSLLDEDLAQRLADAFARHPCVMRVERVEIVRPRQVRVWLEYRKPVLAVPLDGGLRAVDRDGVLLPITTATDGLPVFRGRAQPPAGPAGTRWGDPAV